MASSTKYVRKRTRIEVADNPEFKSRFSDTVYEDTYEAEILRRAEVLAVTSSGTEIQLDYFTTIDELLITNTDKKNFVDTTHRSTPGGGTTQHTRIYPGQTVSLGAISSGINLTLVADTAPCECIVEIWGA